MNHTDIYKLLNALETGAPGNATASICLSHVPGKLDVDLRTIVDDKAYGARLTLEPGALVPMQTISDHLLHLLKREIDKNGTPE